MPEADADEELTAWIVEWRYRGAPEFIDFDDQLDALRMAQMIEESQDRELVRVFRQPFPPVDEATLARVKERVWRKIQSEALLESLVERHRATPS